MTRENPAPGNRRLPGELARPGYAIAASTVREILHAAGTGQAPGGPGWREFVAARAHAVIAGGFLAAEMVLLKRLYVLVYTSSSAVPALAGCVRVRAGGELGFGLDDRGTAQDGDARDCQRAGRQLDGQVGG